MDSILPGRKTYDIDEKEDIKKEKQAIDNTTTTSRFFVRLSMANKTKNGKIDTKWNNESNVNLNESNLQKMILEYCDNENLRKKIAEQLTTLKEAYEDTLIENPNLRMYDVSI